MREWLDAPPAFEPAGADLLAPPAPPAPLVPLAPLALAWALKEACYAAWGREPARAADRKSVV